MSAEDKKKIDRIFLEFLKAKDKGGVDDELLLKMIKDLDESEKILLLDRLLVNSSRENLYRNVVSLNRLEKLFSSK